MSFVFFINNVEFWIDEFDDGFNWNNIENAEGPKSFETIREAQQDAIEYVQNNIAYDRMIEEHKAEDRIYGSYETQVFREHNYRIRG